MTPSEALRGILHVCACAEPNAGAGCIFINNIRLEQFGKHILRIGPHYRKLFAFRCT